MNIVFFLHPDFLGHQSMPRFANILVNGMKKRGHQVEVWAPKARISVLPAPNILKKWLGYIDQYVIFPVIVKNKLKSVHKNTLFVFTDNALGPWVPLVSNRPHVIHCHDFLAQRSAFEGINENKTGLTGKLYQKLIRNGYTQGKYFISVSKKTQSDLHRFLITSPKLTEVVYNAMNRSFAPQQIEATRINLSREVGIDLSDGYILHIGGNQWYKNRLGIIEIYNALRSQYSSRPPLVLIGTKPNELIKRLSIASPYQKDIHFLSDCSDETVKNAYAGASVLLYPSLDEGFGWPIAEAMASGCPVVTTNEPPMTEVGNSAGFYIPKRPANSDPLIWASEAAKVVYHVLSLSPLERNKIIEQGLENVKRFDQTKMLDTIEPIYSSIIVKEK